MSNINVGDRFANQGTEGLNQSNAAQAAQATGNFRGQQVRVVNNSDSLLSAAEELTFGQSENAEKRLSERKDKKTRSTGIQAAQQAENAQLQVKTLKGIKPEDLESFIKALKSSGAKNPEDVRKLLEEFFEDPAEQYSVLEWAEEALADDPAYQDLTGPVVEARKEIEVESGEEIRAAKNIDDLDSSAVGTAKDARGLYRNTVIGRANISETFTHLMEKYGPDRFSEALGFLVKAVGTDIAAVQPSIDRAELKTINDDMYQIEVLANIHRDFSAFLGKLEKDHNSDVKLTAFDLMREFFNVKDERMVSSHAVKNFMPLKGREDATFDVALLQGFKTLVHKMPLKIYSDQETRQPLLDAIQAAVDEAVDLEEEMLEE